MIIRRMTIHILYFHSNRGQEGSMEKEKWWFNSMLFNRELEYRCGLSKSMEGIEPIGKTHGSEDLVIDKNTYSWGDSDSSSCDNVDHLFDVKGIRSFISDDTFLVRDSYGDNYSIYFDIENQIFEIDNNHSFLGELESSFSSYLNNGSKSDDQYYDRYMYDTKYSWNNHINSCIDNYLHSEIGINSDFSSGSDNYSKGYIYSYICNESDSDERDFYESDSDESDSDERDFHESDSDERDFYENGSDERDSDERDFYESDSDERDFHESDSHKSDSHMAGNSNDIDNDTGINKNYRHLWVQCENCYGLNYKKFFRLKLSICEQCGYHLKMSSSDRIELSIDPGTWDSMDEDMVSVDPIEFHSEEEPYKDRIDSYQKKTGLTEAVQTGIGQLNGIPIAIGVMDFQFMGGSMGSVVGEKITRLIEYATNRSLPLIIVCASGGARMQEGSLSLMQMAKISSASYNYQSNKKLLYVSILTSPTTGGVTASFGMLGDIIIAEPNAYIAFAGKRVIEQTLNKTVPEGSQSAEYLFQKGLFDPIVPRNPLKGVLSELFQFHGFFSVNQNSIFNQVEQ
uniref:Acetyl-coenzyme A carboxylase carboxyl transferase subunit beta, chloroplastic n=3 Tax=Ranzania japonica TaxID=63353 RepID=A0A385NFV2_9MAGN|nr:acetyl-CoA carboxylase carboxyltransferase beta subunit [Ranzania japonica]AYA72699.1 acetyl-CoA carboxylase carboxyltransferase beta subunit [Ranzania japonica]